MILERVDEEFYYGFCFLWKCLGGIGGLLFLVEILYRWAIVFLEVFLCVEYLGLRLFYGKFIKYWLKVIWRKMNIIFFCDERIF